MCCILFRDLVRTRAQEMTSDVALRDPSQEAGEGAMRWLGFSELQGDFESWLLDPVGI